MLIFLKLPFPVMRQPYAIFRLIFLQQIEIPIGSAKILKNFLTPQKNMMRKAMILFCTHYICYASMHVMLHGSIHENGLPFL
jgi:hypothetical protein